MLLGTAIWTITRNPPYEDTIKKIAEMGFQGVELIGWDDNAYREYYTSQKNRELKKLIQDLGLTLTNFSFNPKELCNEQEPIKREQNHDTYKRAVQTAYELGCPNLTSVSPYPFALYLSIPSIKQIPILHTWTIDADLNRDWEGNYALYVEEMKWCCETAGRAGLKVLLEPHPYRWVSSADSMLRLIEHVQADNLGMNFDSSHLFRAGDMPQVTIYRLRGRVWHAHISDNDTFTNAHWVPGKGKVDWSAVLKAFADTGYDGALSIELEDGLGAATETEPSTPQIWEESARSIQYIRQVAGELGIQI